MREFRGQRVSAASYNSGPMAIEPIFETAPDPPLRDSLVRSRCRIRAMQRISIVASIAQLFERSRAMRDAPGATAGEAPPPTLDDA